MYEDTMQNAGTNANSYLENSYISEALLTLKFQNYSDLSFENKILLLQYLCDIALVRLKTVFYLFTEWKINTNYVYDK